MLKSAQGPGINRALSTGPRTASKFIKTNTPTHQPGRSPQGTAPAHCHRHSQLVAQELLQPPKHSMHICSQAQPQVVHHAAHSHPSHCRCEAFKTQHEQLHTLDSPALTFTQIHTSQDATTSTHDAKAHSTKCNHLLNCMINISLSWLIHTFGTPQAA